MKKYRRDPTIILQNHKKRVIPAKAGIQGSYTTPLRTYWIPAFAGMTLSLHLFTSSDRSHRSHKSHKSYRTYRTNTTYFVSAIRRISAGVTVSPRAMLGYHECSL